MVKYLMEEAGVDKENTSYHGWTPLFVAVANRQTAVVEYLLDNGCGIEATFQGRSGPSCSVKLPPSKV